MVAPARQSGRGSVVEGNGKDPGRGGPRRPSPHDPSRPGAYRSLPHPLPRRRRGPRALTVAALGVPLRPCAAALLRAIVAAMRAPSPGVPDERLLPPPAGAGSGAGQPAITPWLQTADNRLVTQLTDRQRVWVLAV